jgi:uncharacterized cupin superfamily protein
MRRRNLDVLIAWLDAVRRRDRDAMASMLGPGATWQGIRDEWFCSTPEEVIGTWLLRADELTDVETVEMTAGEGRAALHLRAPSLATVDPRLRYGVHIGFEIDADGRIARIFDGDRRRNVLPTDPDSAPQGVPEAPVRDGVPAGEGWFVVNVAEAPWKTGHFGAYATFEGDVRFEQVGVNIGVLEPGQPACWYHREPDQEDFLVLKGEALLIIEGQERRLRAWDLVHCPPWTEHVFVGAGEEPCAVLALGARWRDGGVYPVSDVALRHRAGVREQKTVPAEAYAEIPPDEPTAFDPGWLPGA